MTLAVVSGLPHVSGRPILTGDPIRFEPPAPAPPDLPEEIPANGFIVVGDSVIWDEIVGATRYKIAFRQNSAGSTNYVASAYGDDLTAPRTNFTFPSLPPGLTEYTFEVAWTWFDGSDHWGETGGWKAITLPPPPFTIAWAVNESTVTWTAVPGATAYHVRYRQNSTSAISEINGLTGSSYTFTELPSGVSTSPFEVDVGATTADGTYFSGQWKSASINSTPPPPDPPSGTLIFSRPARTVSFSSGANAGTNTGTYFNFGATDWVEFECEFEVSFPSSFRWSNGGFKMPGPGGGGGSNNFVPNGCTNYTAGWSARLQGDGANSGGGGLTTSQMRIAAYPYLSVRNPPSVAGVSVQATSSSSGSCGTILRPTSSAAIVNAGETVRILQRILLSTGDTSADGRIRIWRDDTLILDHPGLSFYTDPLSHLIEQWYFGGSNVSPQSQSLTTSAVELRGIA